MPTLHGDLFTRHWMSGQQSMFQAGSYITPLKKKLRSSGFGSSTSPFNALCCSQRMTTAVAVLSPSRTLSHEKVGHLYCICTTDKGALLAYTDVGSFDRKYSKNDTNNA